MPRNWKEWRRMQALHLKQTGWNQHEIAQALGVTKGAVSQWMAMVREGGITALHSRSSPGSPPQLPPSQMRLIPDCLSHGAEAYGFRGEVWTCRRIAEVIKMEFGVSWDECFADGSFAPAKKGEGMLAKRSAARERSGWDWSMARVLRWEHS